MIAARFTSISSCTDQPPPRPSMSADVQNALTQWAEHTPRIRRLWIIGGPTTYSPEPDGDIDIAVEIEPVGDSEETLTVWMVNSETWHAQLQQQISLQVDLEWFDPDGSTPKVRGALRERGVLVYDRATHAD
jgi:predicted nucleotidyltransferase